MWLHGEFGECALRSTNSGTNSRIRLAWNAARWALTTSTTVAIAPPTVGTTKVAQLPVPAKLAGLGMVLSPAEIARIKELTGLDLSPEMLRLARKRAEDMGRAVDLREGDAQQLPFEDESFDSVVCTYSLCCIPDLDRSVAEMNRVLKPGGRLRLLDHIRSSLKPVYWIQKALEIPSRRFQGEHWTRRPLESVERNGFEVRERDRSRLGVVERLSAAKPL